ncbi:hypothetical protein [Amycolatopsis sp. CA-230715]|uniref:hypothetical protein n=1 Tax=Amycolatopsis sp. CA-230715 TaxID=2745196 RepID=UPI001C017B5E|nr:hypothetical protein [Amycolatopsis sp. CA-230715]QWF85674.1 hypothetical protein HUW46_09129 [Amycolatopsis sp. CA-230715]
MFRHDRTVVVLCLLSTVLIAVAVGWATGFLASVGAAVCRIWDGVISWLYSPFGWDHLLAGAGVLIVPILIVVIILVLAND